MTFDPSTMVVFDIDTINAFMKSGGELYKPETEVVKPNMEKIIQESAKYIRILSFVDKHFGDKEHAKAETELKINGGPFELHAISGTEGSWKITETLLSEDVIYIPTDLIISNHILQKILPHLKQIIVEKQSICGFYNDDNTGGNPVLYQILDILDINDVFVEGVYTEYCVKENAMAFLAMGKNVWIIRDAVVPYNIQPDDGDNALADMADMGARFINTSEYLNLLKSNFG